MQQSLAVASLAENSTVYSDNSLISDELSLLPVLINEVGDRHSATSSMFFAMYVSFGLYCSSNIIDIAIIDFLALDEILVKRQHSNSTSEVSYINIASSLDQQECLEVLASSEATIPVSESEYDRSFDYPTVIINERK